MWRECVINDLSREEIFAMFCNVLQCFAMFWKELQKTNQKEFRVEELTKKKGDKPHVKRKGYDQWFV